MRRGDRGEAVKRLQQQLSTISIKTGISSINPGAIDGIFGPMTESAVKAFQNWAGIPVDGIVGPLTQAALDRALSTNQIPTAPMAASTSPIGSFFSEIDWRTVGIIAAIVLGLILISSKD